MNKNTIYSFVDVWEVFIAEGKFWYIGADPLFSRTHLLVFNKRPLQQSSVSNILIIFIVSMCCNKNKGMGETNPQPLHWFSKSFFVKTYHNTYHIILYFFQQQGVVFPAQISYLIIL